MQEQLKRVKLKLKQLKREDPAFTIFGANKHRYKLNPPIGADTIKRFEEFYSIKLPSEYTLFLTQLGNGGAGPFYGLEPLKNVLFADLDYKDSNSLLNPSIPFPHLQEWNMNFKPAISHEENEVEYYFQLEQFEEVYFNKNEMAGTIAICNYGCGVKINMVVNGQEYGNVWTDDRVSDNGIYPSRELGNEGRLKFLDWYELWLDNSLSEVLQPIPQHSQKSNINTQKAWWKFW